MGFMPPARKKRYVKPEVKRAAEPGKIPRSSAMRTARIKALEATLGQYFSSVRRLEKLKGEKTPDRAHIEGHRGIVKNLKTGIMRSIKEIVENYTLSDAQKEIIKKVVKALDEPTEENKTTAMRLTCGLKMEE